MNDVFLDSVGLLAIWNRRDQWHAVALAAIEDLTKTRIGMVTSSFVLLECGNAATRYSFRSLVTSLRDELRNQGKLIDPTGEDIESAWTAYNHGEANNAGIVDQVSFVVMRRLGLTRAFTNDLHNRAAGFETMF